MFKIKFWQAELWFSRGMANLFRRAYLRDRVKHGIGPANIRMEILSVAHQGIALDCEAEWLAASTKYYAKRARKRNATWINLANER